MSAEMEIFLVCMPGLEPQLLAEAQAAGFTGAVAVAGGVSCVGTWGDVQRANLVLRGAGRVLVRIGAFRAMHLAQLDKRARRFPWADFLRPDVPLRVEVTCRASRIYHAGAAQQRIERALVEELGATLAPDAPLTLKARIEDDLCTFSIDTSGAPLHQRGFKTEVGKAPLRETLAALLLRAAGFDPNLPLVDPMCGSGTFVLEAAEIAAGLHPGRARDFAFTHLKTFDEAHWQQMRTPPGVPSPALRFFGSDRDAGAVRASTANAARAGVSDWCRFTLAPISALIRPEGPAGLVMVNPPYGGRIGNPKALFALYGALGQVLRAGFGGWRVGLVSSDPALVRATGLPWLPPARRCQTAG
jgi:putative N6-adenine-specific DNA methylase